MNANLIKDFENIAGKEQVMATEVDRQAYSYDAAVLTPQVPALVVVPTNEEQLGKTVSSLTTTVYPLRYVVQAPIFPEPSYPRPSNLL